VDARGLLWFKLILRHTATHCTTLQHAASHCIIPVDARGLLWFDLSLCVVASTTSLLNSMCSVGGCGGRWCVCVCVCEREKINSRHLRSLTAANWVSFDFKVSFSSCWGYSLINTLKLKKCPRRATLIYIDLHPLIDGKVCLELSAMDIITH